MTKLPIAKSACVFFAFCFAAAIAAPAQTFTVVHNFDNGPNDPHWNATVQGRDGDMYSTTPQVWSGQSGDIFKITPGGTLTDLFTFDGTDGICFSRSDAGARWKFLRRGLPGRQLRLRYCVQGNAR